MVDNNNTRCRQCKFHYIKSNYSNSVLPPQVMCGKTASSAHDDPCDHFERMNQGNDNWFYNYPSFPRGVVK